ncbi:uncharacterized protein LOC135150627 isoform X2 [Daucus carota subsp. sativus]|uniref:uncharacterized protein LOC135150627 isoform X2 n=1 Tax=Daucus carota subsp. sativus TaxID=79200 RepID=UPI003082D3CC
MEVDWRPNLGGMEKAFSMNVMMLIVKYFAGCSITHCPAPATKQKRKRKEICSRSSDRVCGAWDSLPDELLLSVLMKLNIIDYLAFSGVCRSWRSVSTDIRKSFMERLQPFVLARPRYSKKACVLYNIFDWKSCKSMLPNMPRKSLWGLSSGYLITYDKNMGFWLVNLMTRHELHYPVLPESSYSISDFTACAVLLRSTRLSRIFMIIFSEKHDFLLMSESGSSSWHEYLLPNTSSGIADVKILDGKIFVLTCDAHFGEFNPRADPVLKLYNRNFPIPLPSRSILKLVTSDNKIYMVISQHPCPRAMLVLYLSLYELDYSMESVKQIHDLGSKSLFLSVFNSALVDTTGWGSGNCVCVLQNTLGKCTFFHLDGQRIATVPSVFDDYLRLYFWFFPGESWDISRVGDEFGT